MTPRLVFLHVGGPLLVGAGLAVIGPYGTYAQLSLGTRLIYWCAIVAANWAQMVVLGRLARHLLPPPRWAPQVPVVAAACCASLPAAGEVMLLEHWLRPGAMAAAGLVFAELYFLVLVITLPFSLLIHRLVGQREAALPAPLSADERRSTFFERLPARLGRDVLCLRTEDHYLRVYTSLGDDLILMRMSDAEAELAGWDGMRVHRSWWVARAAIVCSERDSGGKLVLGLSNGLEVPVSRNAVGALRRAGWLV